MQPTKNVFINFKHRGKGKLRTTCDGKQKKQKKRMLKKQQETKFVYVSIKYN